MIAVVAVITAKPGQRAALLEAFHANVPAVRAEAGCLEYAGAIDADGFSFAAPMGADTFVVLEKWADGDALRAHARAPHMAAYAAATKELVANRMIHVLAPAD